MNNRHLTKAMFQISIFIFVLLFSFCACQHSEKEAEKSILPPIKKEYHFDLKADASRYRANIYYDKSRKEQLIYFYDHKTDKAIKVFNMKGKLIENISLKKILEIEKAMDIHIVSLDTIWVSTYITNKLICVNRKGMVWQNISLTPLLLDSLGNQYELWRCKTIDNQANIFWFSMYWIHNIKERASKQEPKDFYDYRRYLNINRNKAPMYCKIQNVYNKNISLQHAFHGFYQNFIGVDEAEGSPTYSIANKDIFLMSIYTDTLYIGNIQTLKFKQKIKIKSQYTPIGKVKPFKTDNASIEYYDTKDISNINNTSAGYMTNMLYDSKNKQYALIVTHQRPYDKTYKNLGYDNFSVIFMNHDFEKLKEVPFNFNQKGYFIEPLESSEGLLFLKRPVPYSPKDKTKSYEKAIFTLFDFDK